MNKIICKIDPSLGKQHILFYDNEKCEDQEAVEMNGLIEYLIHTCYTSNCYNVHFIGNWQYIQGLIEQLSTQEAVQYNTHKILIEVN